MKKHILWLIVGLLLLALLLWGATSFDTKISMPLLGSQTVGNGTANDNNTVDDGNGAGASSDDVLADPAEEAAAVDALIAKIGSPVTADSKAAIEAARAAYDKLSDDAKVEVTALLDLEAAEKALAELNTDNAVDTTDADAAAVDALIAKIGSPVTAYSKAAIEAARTAYDKLGDDAKAKVATLSELEAAEKALAALNTAADTTDKDEPTENDNAASGSTFAPGTKVTFLGGKVYVSSTAGAASKTIDAQSACTVTYYVGDAEHPYHLISQDGGGVYGWVDASSVKEG